MSQIEPRRAAVRPRIRSEASGALLLEDGVAGQLASAESGAICVFGPSGWGKSVALAHLAVTLPRGSMATLLDDPPEAMVRELATDVRVVYTAAVPFAMPHLSMHRLASWGIDECLEYLMELHREACSSVMNRLGRNVDGPPGLMAIVMDELARDSELPDMAAAVARRIDRDIPRPVRVKAGHACFHHLTRDCARVVPGTRPSDPPPAWVRYLEEGGAPPVPVGHLLAHLPVRLRLAAERVLVDLKAKRRIPALEAFLPRELIREIGRLLKQDREAVASLLDLVDVWPTMAVSLLHAADIGWRPEPGDMVMYTRAQVPGAYWPGVRLDHAGFERADLSGAFLRDATLTNTTFHRARLTGADLCGAAVEGSSFVYSDLSHADLAPVRGDHVMFSGADLRGCSLEGSTLPRADFQNADLRDARLRRAGLAEANFLGARMEGADLSMADLESAMLLQQDLRRVDMDGASLQRAVLRRAVFDRLRLKGTKFDEADLRDASFTGSVFQGVSFVNAVMRGARLGDVDWPRADLRGADLRGSTFHMGSSRSGLLFDAPPGEGSRTGFYTDDYNDLSHRDPVEIRKANLCGADLRGAKVGDTDFYLVDLRGALYDWGQEDHFRRCGAILGVMAD